MMIKNNNKLKTMYFLYMYQFKMKTDIMLNKMFLLLKSIQLIIFNLTFSSDMKHIINIIIYVFYNK